MTSKHRLVAIAFLCIAGIAVACVVSGHDGFVVMGAIGSITSIAGYLFGRTKLNKAEKTTPQE